MLTERAAQAASRQGDRVNAPAPFFGVPSDAGRGHPSAMVRTGGFARMGSRGLPVESNGGRLRLPMSASSSLYYQPGFLFIRPPRASRPQSARDEFVIDA